MENNFELELDEDFQSCRYDVDPEYEYYFLPRNGITEAKLKKYGQWIMNSFDRTCQKKLTLQLNSEWVARHYLAAKMIMSSTLMLNSMQYSKEANVLISVPYLMYYATVCCSRALLFTTPEVTNSEFKNVVTITHSKMIKLTSNAINKLDMKLANKIRNYLLQCRSNRELFSYKFPARGINLISQPEIDNVINVCGILVEIAQYASKCIENYIETYCLEDIKEWKGEKFDPNYITACFKYNLDEYDSVEKKETTYSIVDNEDWYRVDFINRKQVYPSSIFLTMTEGMTEDFFGAWYPIDQDLEDEQFNPDKGWNIIFNIP
ncbi:hypothetical protein [Clostridium sp. ZS1]|uniref:hypothetical protein n=1 Tax=Clostridium sp. ZS1 TaxID=2949989 RepID=UPI00207A955B|nr:hypothetical protein [Clostridium sp. ZS1]